MEKSFTVKVKGNRFSPLAAESWEQNWTVLPWFNTILATEKLKIKNVAGRLTGEHFSRTELLKLASEGRTDIPVLPGIPMELPKEAENLQVRDEIGIIWGSKNTRVVGDRLITDVPARYPLANGWKAFLSVSFSLRNFVRKTRGRREIRLDLGKTLAMEAPVYQYAACIVLPEDSRYFYPDSL